MFIITERPSAEISGRYKRNINSEIQFFFFVLVSIYDDLTVACGSKAIRRESGWKVEFIFKVLYSRLKYLYINVYIL